MNTALEYSTRVVQEGDRRCKKSTLNDLAYLTPLRIPLMNPVLDGNSTAPQTRAAGMYKQRLFLPQGEKEEVQEGATAAGSAERRHGHLYYLCSVQRNIINYQMP